MNRQRLFLFALSLSFLGTIPSPSAGAACPPPLVSEVPVDRAAGLDAGDRLGHAVALGGGVGAPPFAAVAAPLSDGRGNGAGEVRLYRVSRDAGAAPLPLRDPVSVVGSDTTAFDAFGFALSLARNAPVLAVGAPFHDEPNGGGNSGAVYLFEGTTFRQSARLIPPSPELDDQFGSSVALSADGSFLAVGAPGRRGRGAVFLYRGGPDGWTLERELSDPEGLPGDQFGLSVAVDPRGGTILAGAPQILGPTASGPGKALLFGGDGSRLRNLSVGGQVADAFGYSVAIASSGLLLVGAPGGDAPGDGDRAGAVYVFGSNDRTSKLAACAASKGAEMGFSLAAEGDTAIVGVRRGGEEKAGGALLFRCSASSCAAIGPLASSDPGPGAELGRSVALAGDLALVGAPLADRGGEGDVGAAVALDLGGVVARAPKVLSGPRAIPGTEFRVIFELESHGASTDGLTLPVKIALPEYLHVQCQIAPAGPGSTCVSRGGSRGTSSFDVVLHKPALVTFEVSGFIPAEKRGSLGVTFEAQTPAGFEVPRPGASLRREVAFPLVPDLPLELSIDAPSTAIPGKEPRLQFTVTVTNRGRSALNGAKVDVEISGMIRSVSGDTAGTNCSFDASKGKHRCSLATALRLSPGKSKEFLTSGEIPESALRTIVLVADVKPAGGEGSPLRKRRNVGLEPKIHLVTTMPVPTPDSNLVPGGGAIRYDFRVDHGMNSYSLLRGAQVVAMVDSKQLDHCVLALRQGDRLDAQASGDKPRYSIGRFSPGAPPLNFSLICNVKSGAANERANISGPIITIEDLVPNPSLGEIDARGATADDVRMRPIAQLEIDFERSPPSAVPGKGLELCFSVENQGPSDLPHTSVTVTTGCTKGTEGSCLSSVEIVCSRNRECPSLGSANLQNLLFRANSKGSCWLRGDVIPAGREYFETTVNITGRWPDNGEAQLVETTRTLLLPEAEIEVHLTNPDFTSPEPDSLDPWRVAYKVTLTNHGPSQANDLEIELFQPALLTNVEWCPSEVGTDQCPPDSQDTLPGGLRQKLAKLEVGEEKSKTYLVTADFANPLPRGPLVLAATVISHDAAPKGRQVPGFQGVPLPRELSEDPPTPHAALVVAGKFEKAEVLQLRAFLDDPREVSSPPSAGGREAKFEMDLPSGLIPVCASRCEGGSVTSCEGQTVKWKGNLEVGEGREISEVTFCAQVDPVVADTSFTLRGKLFLADESGNFDEDPHESHCPGSAMSPSDTVFSLGEQTSDSCGAFPIGE